MHSLVGASHALHPSCSLLGTAEAFVVHALQYVLVAHTANMLDPTRISLPFPGTEDEWYRFVDLALAGPDAQRRKEARQVRTA